MVADIVELEIWKRHKSWLEDLMRRMLSCRNMVKISYSPSQLEQSSCLEEVRFSEGPPQFRITLHERSSRRVGRVSTIRHADG